MAQNAQGVTITFATSSYTAELVNVELGNSERASLRTSHHGTTGAHTFIPADLVDEGDVTVELHGDGDTPPPIDQPVEQITVQFPPKSGQATGARFQGPGFLTTYSLGGPLDELITGAYTLKWAGAVTRTPGA